MTKGNLNNKNYLHIFKYGQQLKNREETKILVATSGVLIVWVFEQLQIALNSISRLELCLRNETY